MTPKYCPINKIHTTYKVSAIASAGSSTIQVYADIPFAFQGYAQTHLAAQLASPLEPIMPIREDPDDIAGWIVGLAGAVYLLCCCSPLCFMSKDDFATKNDQWQYILITVGGGGIVLIGLVVVAYAIQKDSTRRREAVYQKALHDWRNYYARWKRAMTYWEDLYYCPNDHIIFLGRQPMRSAPADRTGMINLINYR